MEWAVLPPKGIIDGFRARNRKPLEFATGPINNKRNTRAKRELGDIQGDLTLVKVVAHTKHGHELFGCICSCGEKVLISASAFNGKRTSSCGCKKRKSEYHSSYVQLRLNYIRNAKNRGLDFDLSIEDFKALCSQNCYYCGSPPSARLDYSGARLRQPDGPLVYNGIDRMFNEQGYSVSNCVACCKNCNRMKWNMDLSEFINHAWRISAFSKTGKADGLGAPPL